MSHHELKLIKGNCWDIMTSEQRKKYDKLQSLYKEALKFDQVQYKMIQEFSHFSSGKSLLISLEKEIKLFKQSIENNYKLHSSDYEAFKKK